MKIPFFMHYGSRRVFSGGFIINKEIYRRERIIINHSSFSRFTKVKLTLHEGRLIVNFSKMFELLRSKGSRLIETT